ncbi:hypothetical protein CK203_019423 [Vitis vinifera]|uniref:Uncharacterized protein n=1 Tax=Vitis vinifera TaxID=29760 RepID=A0A438IZ86_VITVI|nr:hypothetical protein CK203_019423 [Vitis vinifera]
MDPQRPSNFLLDSPQLSSQTRSMGWKNYRHSPRTPITPLRMFIPNLLPTLLQRQQGFPNIISNLGMGALEWQIQLLLFVEKAIQVHSIGPLRWYQEQGRGTLMLWMRHSIYPLRCTPLPWVQHSISPWKQNRVQRRCTLSLWDAAFNMPIEMERRGRQMRPLTPRVRGQGTYNRQFDMGFWNGQ